MCETEPLIRRHELRDPLAGTALCWWPNRSEPLWVPKTRPRTSRRFLDCAREATGEQGVEALDHHRVDRDEVAGDEAVGLLS